MDYHHIIWIETAWYAMSNFLLTMLLRKPSMHIQQISQILKNRRQVILVFWEYECVIVCYQMYFYVTIQGYLVQSLSSSRMYFLLNIYMLLFSTPDLAASFQQAFGGRDKKRGQGLDHSEASSNLKVQRLTCLWKALAVEVDLDDWMSLYRI
ncbi:hypothetical protein ACJX0J_012184 [Zea mays]